MVKKDSEKMKIQQRQLIESLSCNICVRNRKITESRYELQLLNNKNVVVEKFRVCSYHYNAGIKELKNVKWLYENTPKEKLLAMSANKQLGIEGYFWQVFLEATFTQKFDYDNFFSTGEDADELRISAVMRLEKIPRNFFTKRRKK